MVGHGRYVIAEVAVSRDLFRKILSHPDDLRRRPAPAYAEEIDGQEKAAGEVCLDDGKYGQITFRTRENRKISPSDGRGESSDPSTGVRGYDFYKLGGHLGNVSSSEVFHKTS